MDRIASPDRPPSTSRSKGRTPGRTLAVIGVLAVALGVVSGVWIPRILRTLPHESEDTVHYQVRILGGALELYALENRHLPMSLDELTRPSPTTNEPYMKSIPLDPWNRPFAYEIVNPVTREFRVTCTGEDGRRGTQDDVTYPDRDPR